MTFASKITISRIALVPVYAVLAALYGTSVSRGDANETLRWWALGVFVFAAVTDGVDGWIARRFNQRSDFGAFIDPMADKMLLLTGVLVLTVYDWGADGWSLPWWFAAVVVAKDVVVLGGLVVLRRAGRKVKIQPHWVGKICTVSQMFALGWVMLKVVPFSPGYPCIIAAFFTIWSAIEYVRRGVQILHGD